MPQHAMSCSPVIGGDESAPEQVVDFSVESNRPFVDPNELYTLDNQGNAQYETPADPTQYDPEESFNMGSYMNDLMESNPTLKQAFAWGEKNLPDETIEQFNMLVADADLAKLHEGIEWITQQFNEFGMESPMEESEPQPDFSDDQVAEIESQYPVEQLLDYLSSNYDSETIELFDDVVNNGSFEQVQHIYSTLYQEYLEES